MWELFQLGIIWKEEIGIIQTGKKKVNGILMSYYISNAWNPYTIFFLISMTKNMTKKAA